MRRSKRVTFFKLLEFVLFSIEIVTKVAHALSVRIDVPQPGALLRVSCEFMYMMPSWVNNAGAKKFLQGTVFLLVQTNMEKGERFVMGDEAVMLTMLGPDNRLWNRSVPAHSFADMFEIVKRCA